MWKSAGWLAKKHGVSRIAIGNWIRDGRYEKVERTKGGHYRVWVNDPECVIGYARVSSRKQMSSIESQSAIIREHYPAIEIVSDVGSGFNFKRRGLKSILERCLSGSSACVVVSSGDRLARAGYQFIKWAIELHGGSIVELEKVDQKDDFDTDDLVRFITCFIASYHGKRSHRRKKSKGVSRKK